MRLVVISDIHGNLPALEKAFAFIDKIKIDGIIWCGDYITDILLSSEVLEFIKLKNEKYRHWIIKGNREDYIINYHSKKSNFESVDGFGSLMLTYKSLKYEDIKYISSLPDEVVVDIKGCPQIYVSHKLNNDVKYKYNVFGHIHKQCLFVKNDCKYINPGSVGQCCSGTPGLEFALLELVDGEWSSHFYHMSYNLEFVTKFIRNSELSSCSHHWSDILIKTLETGHNYVEEYIEEVKRIALKCGVEFKNLVDIPDKIWDFVFDRLEIEKKVN